ncbi:MAG: glycosyltransferase [archaeon]
MSKVLVVVMWSLFSEDGKADGTRIRCFEIAKALQRKGHEVVIGQTTPKKEKEGLIDGLPVIQITPGNAKEIASKFDVIVTYPNEFLFTLAEKIKDKPLVIDLYDPRLMNNILLGSDEFKSSQDSMRLLKALSVGDLFLCANDNQRIYYSSLLGLVRKGDPEMKLLVRVPFGIPLESVDKTLPIDNNKIIRSRLVPDKTKVLLWPGEMYPWFDPLTAINAFKKVLKKRKDVALVFAGSTHFENLNKQSADKRKEIESALKSSGLLNRKIFFIPWMPYKERGALYKESDLALVTYTSSLENELSCRTRIVDCLWGEIPVICSEGDPLSVLVKEKGLGLVVPEKDADALAKSILMLLKSPAKVSAIRKNIQKQKKELSWDKAIVPLDRFCDKPSITAKNDVLSDQSEKLERANESLALKLSHTEGLLSHFKEEAAALHKEKESISKELYLCKERLASTEKDLAKLMKIVDEKEAALASRGEQLSISKKDITKLEKQLADNERSFAGQKEQLTRSVQHLEKEGEQQRIIITKKEIEIKHLKEEESRLNDEIRWRNEKLDSIYSSKLYRYVCSPIWNAHDRLMGNASGKKRLKKPSSGKNGKK